MLDILKNGLGLGRSVLGGGRPPRKTLNLNSTTSVEAWATKYGGSVSRASAMWVPDKNGVFRETPINKPAIWGGEWDGTNSRWLPASGAGMAFWAPVGNAMSAGKFRDFSAWDSMDFTPLQNQTGVDGVANSACFLEDSDGATPRSVTDSQVITSSSNPISSSFMVRADSDQTRYPEFWLDLYGGTGQYAYVQLNTATGEVAVRDSAGTVAAGAFDVLGLGVWWFLWIAVKDNDSGNSVCRTRVYPARSTTLGGIAASATGSVVVDWAQLFIGEERPCPFLVPGGESIAAQQFDFLNYNLIHDSRGSIFADCETMPDFHESGPYEQIIEYGGGSYDSGISLAGNQPGVYIGDDVNTENRTPADESFKVVHSWEGSSQTITLDGSSTSGNYDGSIIGSFDPERITIGGCYGDTTRSFDGVIRQIIFNSNPQTPEYWEGKTS